MKEEYDFQDGERGKFYASKAKLRIPTYLDDDVRSYFLQLAESKGISLDELVNDLLKKEIAVIETVR